LSPSRLNPLCVRRLRRKKVLRTRDVWRVRLDSDLSGRGLLRGRLRLCLLQLLQLLIDLLRSANAIGPTADQWGSLSLVEVGGGLAITSAAAGLLDRRSLRPRGPEILTGITLRVVVGPLVGGAGAGHGIAGYVETGKALPRPVVG